MPDLTNQLMERVSSDEGFRERLRKDPKAALAEIGVNVPPDVEIQVHEPTKSTKHLVVPEASGSEIAGCVETTNTWVICTV